MRAYAREHRFAAGLTVIALVGLLWRVIYAVVMRHDPIACEQTSCLAHAVGSDGFRYHFGALLLADGHGFVNPLTLLVSGQHVVDVGHPPGWTILLAGATKLGLRSWLQHGLFASVIGTATIVMTGLAAKAGFGSRVGLIAAALAAGYPGFFLYEREVLSEPLAMLGIATTIWLAYKFIKRPSAELAVGLGAVIGLLASTKSDQLAIAVVLVAPLILSRRAVDIWKRIGWLAAAATVCVTILAPWSVYLSVLYNRPVLSQGGLGVTMAAGNCPATYHGELLGYFVFDCAIVLRPGDPITTDNLARDRAETFMRDNASRVPVVMAARLGRTFSFYRPFQEIRLEFSGGIRWVVTWGVFEYWALLPFAIAGAVIARRRKVPIYPLLVFPALVVFTVLFTIGQIRYRAPAEIPLVILAAVALDTLLRAWQRRTAPAG